MTRRAGKAVHAARALFGRRRQSLAARMRPASARSAVSAISISSSLGGVGRAAIRCLDRAKLRAETAEASALRLARFAHDPVCNDRSQLIDVAIDEGSQVARERMRHTSSE